MNTYFQIIAGVLIAVILAITISRHNADIAVVLTVAVSAMILLAAASYLEPVIAFFDRLQQLANLDNELFRILLKAVAIGWISQVASLICVDSGYTALSKGIQMMGCAVILWLSLPLMQQLLLLIEKILGEI